MLYNLLKSIITSQSYKDNGDTPETMQAKLDVFLSKNRITLENYNELSALLDAQKEPVVSTEPPA